MIKKILFLIFLLNSIVFAGEWNWQNPKPQGNTINKIAFYDQWYGYMVGESGAILFSSDYGLTWEEQNEGMPDNLYDIAVVDSITAWVAGDNGTILQTSDGGTNWNQQTSNTDQGLNGVFFYDNQTGWACGDNKTILRTIDGGNTWIPVNLIPVPATTSFNSIYFISNKEGWVTGAGGYILRTTTGGQTWNVQKSAGNNISCIKANGNYVLACGEGGMIYISTNSGTKWNPLQTATQNSLDAISIDDLNNIVVAGDNGTILTGSIVSLNWKLDSLRTYASVHGITIVNGVTFAVGDYGFYARKEANWSFFNNCMNDSMNWLLFSDQMNGFCIGQYGRILKTTDGGKNWVNIDNGVTGDSFYGGVVSGNQAWLTGDNGVILFTSDAGKSWIQQTTNTLSTILSISLVTKNELWAGGNSGELYHTSNGGSVWNKVSTGTTEVIFGVKFIDSNNGWIVGDKGMFRATKNGGSTWNNINSSTNSAIFNVDFVNKNLGFCAGTNGFILKTSDGGLNWSTVNSGTTRTLYTIQGVSGNSLWAVGDSGTVLHSNNSGLSWIPDSSFLTNYDLFGLKVLSDTLIYICGDNGTIIGKGTPQQSSPITKKIQLLSPAGGEKWNAASTQTLKWHIENINQIKIELSTDNKLHWTTILASSPAKDSSYNWQIPDLSSINCFVRITDLSDSTYNSINSTAFSIIGIPKPKTLILTSPLGGEKFQAGDKVTINWTSTNIDSIKIQVSFDNKATWISIENSYNAQLGTYNYQIPVSTPESQDCYFKLTDISVDTVFSINKTPFSVQKKTGVDEYTLNNSKLEIINMKNGDIELIINSESNKELNIEIYNILGCQVYNNRSILSNGVGIIISKNKLFTGILFCKVTLINEMTGANKILVGKLLVY